MTPGPDLRPSKGIILFRTNSLRPSESALQLQRRALKTPAARNIMLPSAMELPPEPEIGTQLDQPEAKPKTNDGDRFNRKVEDLGQEVTTPALKKETSIPKPTIAVKEEKRKDGKPLPSEVLLLDAKEERSHRLMGAALTKGQESNSLPMAKEGPSDELMANEQLMMEMADDLNGVEQLLEMTEEHPHQQPVSNDNGEVQRQIQAQKQRSRSDSDTSMTGVADILPAAAEVGGALGYPRETGDDADRELGVGSRRSLVPEYASSSEGTPERSPMVTRARSRQSPGKDAATHDEDSRNVDSGVNGSPGPYYGSAGGMMNPTPELRMRTDEELTDYSNSEYEYDDAEESSESDLEVIDLKALGRKRQGSPLSQAGRPAGQNPGAPKVSKRQQKILEQASHGVELDANGTKKGVVRGMGRDLEYLHRGHWIGAVYHYELRRTLLRVSDELGSYAEQPARGVNDLDRTAFKPEHKFLKLINRDERPDILFQWNPTLEPPAPTETPDFWYDGRRIILDVENHPLRRRPELPLTLSGQCEGLRLEFYKRLNPNISMGELKARMPPQTCRREGLKIMTVQTAALANRMTRDRSRAALKAWTAKQGSKNIEHRLLELMPQNIQREIIRTNNTKCFRDLTVQELTYVEAANLGAVENLAKAGSRLLDQQTRRQREEKRKKDFGLQTYTVIDEARQERPPLVPRPQGFRYLMPTNAPSATPTNDVDDPKRSASPVATAPAKRQKHPEIIDLTIDAEDNDEMEEHSGYTASGVQKVRVGSSKIDSSVSNRVPSGVDFRYKRPVSVADRSIVQEALNLSRDDFASYTGAAPTIKTDRTESYAYQLSQLQDALEQQIGTKYSPPQLKSWGRVSSFEDFRALTTGHASSGDSVKADSVAGEDDMLDFEGPTLVEQEEGPVVAAEPKHHDQVQNIANGGRCLGPREASV
ncbi:MAG: hypothetical protein Q9208_002780 [Pyrenodesmia sp. 3 TL-2023]